MSTDFMALLGQTADSVEKPKPMPNGTYQFNIKSHEFGESSKKGTPFVEFKCSPMQPLEDVDVEALGQVKNWQAKEMRLTFYLTEDAIFMLKEFLGHLGMDTAGRTFAEMIPETVNCQFNGFCKQSFDAKKPDRVFTNIESTAPAS